ncbi:MAG TPA: hypothetical protein VF753_02930 [Terriglobales bacterium]
MTKYFYFAWFTILILTSSLTAQSIEFGLNIGNWKKLNGKPPKVSVDSYRFWDDGAQWAQTNYANGKYSFGVTSNWLHALRKSGINDVLFELGRTPKWASSNPGDKNCDYGNYGTPGECAPPIDLNADGTGPDLIWREWCKAAGQYFSQNSDILVRAWSPWNEFTRHSPTNAWSGTNAQMVRLAQDARAILLGRGTITATGETAEQALKTVGLSAPAYSRYAESSMLSPSSGAWTDLQSRYLNYLSTPGAKEAAEILALHLYAWSADKALWLYNYFRNHSNYDDIPAWNTESSWGATGLQGSQSTYVKDLFSGLASAGVGRSYWYEYQSTAPLVNKDGLTSGGVAWNEVYNQLH